jgi:glycosyltransferase involved in cell wall biosynthesis
MSNFTMPTPQVSIGMPVFNGEPFIREALNSLLAQTYSEFELIISDNASTDGTEAICREYAAKDKRIRYVRQPTNRGALANFQFVLDEAVGEYFMWAATDDLWDVRWIESLFFVASRHQCLAFGHVTAVDEHGIHLNHPANDRKLEYRGKTFTRRLRYYLEPGFLGKANPIYGLIPKRLLTQDALSILALCDCGSDMLFLFNLLRRIEIVSVPYVGMKKRIHPGSASGGIATNFDQKSAYIIRLIIYVFRLLKTQITEVIRYRIISHWDERLVYVLLVPIKMLYEFYANVSYRFKLDLNI